MKVKKPGLIVIYTLPLILSLATWLLGWGILWEILTSGAVLPKNSPGPWFNLLFWTIVVSVNALMGPMLTLKYSLSVYVHDDQMLVGRCFGLFKKSYKTSDIANIDLTSPDGKVPAAKILFINGDTLTISGYASRFQDFCKVISQHL